MSMETIRAREVEKYIGKDCMLIVDVRSPNEYKCGHIKGAISIPFETLEKNMERLNGYDKVILYCDRGNTSLLAARNLMRKGYNVISLGGGLRAYNGNLQK